MRAYNFCAGPAALPTAVLEKAQQEMLDWQGKGLSIMEMSHRSNDYVAVAEKAEADLRKLMNIPENYKVLFLQGGASLQFSAIPLNLLGKNNKADYIHTGIWSEKALKEAKRYGDINIVEAGTMIDGKHAITEQSTWNLSNDAAYVHYADNETIGGLQFASVPDVAAPLVCDYSSSILSAPVDVNKFGLIYAGAQKNIGPAGLTIVIIREDLLDQAKPEIPSILKYADQAKNGSMVNTPATYAWYLSGLVFEWLLEQGGVDAIYKMNQAKAKLLYGYIDSSDFYNNPIAVPNRSMMNVPFTLADEALEKTFLKEAEQNHLLNLAGHRSVGGMRASIYNAVPLEGVQALVNFMDEFAKRHG
ncbi:3-phosphoserine/phosphohydroxythreonine transaminase [Acinetobacter venetianus]|jgi:phosphoserine aminotransferase|uniref:Phosphoserine aminotransferase n=2 Tax=Acinetobacter venetianus TaxID=52133 RepID=N8YLP5_ACIVR|nr:MULTISPECIES: 3-phosphoserine/phosphohydroxythreonine transaminase [Acinetobacter]MDA0695779.1 3-phosphoserine/phosphohydroxythreonine transaminase [Pseudomonadota bacterium]ENV37767.1 phosphoserine aminotransferase [Acinetobacter venetianus RAG-1 = CIP 110063]ERP95041.1 MFS transporter [Acinetobacter sp. COS3]KXO82578.1 3-phosphoserine/phosphohydroxythreonine aminotransferase [Acinetobacter venetianus]KXO83157.1 3-phosphoserine/phosphohydroxythreonine aminotransferase [Acinetobacter veneti